MSRAREWIEAIAPVDSMNPFVLGIDDYGIDGYRIICMNDLADCFEQ